MSQRTSPAVTPGEGEGPGWMDGRDDTFRRATEPYRGKSCVYLRAAHLESGPAGLRARGRFAIPEPSYIDDTGHFNAAEFVVCYNQLMYVALAIAVRDRLLPEFAGWTLDDYWRRQLPDVLIHSLASRFARPIGAHDFSGEFSLLGSNDRKLARGILLLDTEVRFWDDAGGAASGSVGLALVNSPAPTALPRHGAAPGGPDGS